ncbi:unnamed protein product [Linum tenue]|jgi:hypothetical protein
MIE